MARYRNKKIFRFLVKMYFGGRLFLLTDENYSKRCFTQTSSKIINIFIVVQRVLLFRPLHLKRLNLLFFDIIFLFVIISLSFFILYLSTGTKFDIFNQHLLTRLASPLPPNCWICTSLKILMVLYGHLGKSYEVLLNLKFFLISVWASQVQLLNKTKNRKKPQVIRILQI